MSEIPSRESFTDADIESLYRNGYWDEEKIVGAYMGGKLKTDAEWREAIDYEAAVADAARQRALPMSPDEVRHIIDAALGVSDAALAGEPTDWGKIHPAARRGLVSDE